jgi:hypothetical protein
MPNPLGNLAWGSWFYGLIAGAIGGGSAAVTGGFSASVIDPKDFGFGGTQSLKLMALTFGFSALMSAFLYLKQNPLPSIRTEDTHATVTPLPGGAMAVHSIKTTTEEQPPKP